MGVDPESLSLPSQTMIGIFIVVVIILAMALIAVVSIWFFNHSKEREKAWLLLYRHARKKNIESKLIPILKSYYYSLPAKDRLDTLLDPPSFRKTLSAFLALQKLEDEEKLEILNKLFESKRLSHELENVSDLLVGETIALHVSSLTRDMHLLGRVTEHRDDSIILSTRNAASLKGGLTSELHAYRPGVGGYAIPGKIIAAGRSFVQFSGSGKIDFHGEFHLMTYFELQLTFSTWPPKEGDETKEVYRAKSKKVSDRGMTFVFIDHILSSLLKTQSVWQVETILPGDQSIVTRGNIIVLPGDHHEYLFRFIDLSEEHSAALFHFIREHDPVREYLK